MPIPARLTALAPALDPSLSWDELVAVVRALVDGELEEARREQVVDYLDANLPGGQVADLIDWPGDWFGNRWMEEISLAPEDVAFYALERSGRELADAPQDYEPPYPLA